MRDATGPDAPVLAIRGATKRFAGRLILDGLDLALGAGEVYALLGPNGAGKTTTINLILGFLRADAGEVRVGGLDPATAPVAARAQAAYIPEQVALYPGLSGLENLRYLATLAALRLSRSEAGRLLDEAGLAGEAHGRPAAGYSKGMRQKVGIAVALARRARLLLLDEPTSGLDPGASADFARTVRAAASRGTAVLMATHDLYRLREMADRVGVLRAGRIAEEIDPRGLDAAALERLALARPAEEAP
ncbi:ABC transporter ATP-binding protein [Methylobacterium isbiliense]|jgi:ABC-2 type transport system ATP-binding protein|uniref:Multidrug efflux system ATP-binding protein n=1 Tax=Methylobacterium isbiliense TaxID=315478 RepID=A0ABQ4SH47_9HYPH|nr:ABC transporter ATP-binding protein [Methylobacterium isbiliense]MDN3625359.1 ABC transporter ATP-binding protein [Methylobacterium isbiliense]GJE01083.1 Multidrug efflux system ATP-binding protein [Methylobacterium isbiliense]